MKIIINSKILSLPPYISTNWENITSLHVEEVDSQKVLMIFLSSGMQVKIPSLDNQLIDAIFTKHAQFLDEDSKPKKNVNLNQILGSDTILLSPFKLGDLNFDILSNFMHHNSEQKNAPDLPKEILEKISQMLKMMPKEEVKHLPKAEPHCNCFYCQISRTVSEQNDEKLDEQSEITDEDLRFRDWDIKQKDKNLYIVTNPLDKSEEFHVFLGDTIGCTCGKKNCEHIEAVLRS